MVVFLLVHHGSNHGDKANETYHRCNLDATRTVDFWIEGLLGGAASAHQYKADDDNQHAYGQ